MLSLYSLFGYSQTTYYSRDGGTSAWDLATSWTLSSDGIGSQAGPPGQNDYVIILKDHTITVNNVNDNGGPAKSADGLNQSNVGAGGTGNTFPDSNTLNFYHKGEMTVEEGGTLTFAERVMFDGTIFIAGTLTTDFDIIILGNLYFAPSATFGSTDDLICSGFSNTRIDIPDAANAWTSDDIYLDHTDAFVCGLGVLGIGRSGGIGHIINLNNGATLAQLCTVLDIEGCDPNPPLDSPCPSGTTVFSPSIAALTGAGGTINYVENSVLTIDNSITVTYVEPLPYLTAATVTISGGTYVDGQDILELPGISTIVAVFDTGTGTLNLAGYGDVSRWQTALQSITYENLSDNPTAATRTIEFQVNDGFNLSNTISRDITIEAVNDPPDVGTISGSPTPLAYLEGVGDIAIDDQITLYDPDDINLEGATISLTNYIQGEDILDFSNAFGVTKDGFDAVNGILTLTGSTSIANYQMAIRAVTYENLSDTPDLTDRTASFVVNDGDANSPSFSRVIQITATNDVPVATDQSIATNEDTDLDVDLSALVTDADNAVDLTTIAIVTAPTNGTISNINTTTGVVTYTPNLNYNGGDSFTYTIDDVSGGTSNLCTITITVNPINDVPVAIDQSAATNEDTDLDVDLSALVTDIDDALDLTTIAIVTAPTNGTISNINTITGVVTYTPNVNYNGGDSFTYTIDDVSGGTSNSGTITITVNPINDVPVATD
ncbi:MAG: hypothetical protein DRI71_03215, partial [Bacteroidetes bacterium]